MQSPDRRKSAVDAVDAVDAVLVKDALGGDAAALEALLDRHAPRVERRIARRVRDAEVARDLLQDVLVVALTRLAELRQPDRFGAWLGRIADNAALGWHRRRVRQLALDEAFAARAPAPLAQDPGSSTAAEVRRAVRAALRRLSAIQRDVVIHHYVKGYSYLVTAEILGVEVRTVRSRLQKARARLRKELMTMAGRASDRVTLELTREDVDAIERASRVVSRDPSRGALQGVCLDANGRIVGCDGHRLFTAESERLRQLAVPVVLGPVSDLELPKSPCTLELEEASAILRFEERGDRRLPIIDEPYVPYEKVIGIEPSTRAKAPASALREAAVEIADHLHARHPVDADGAWRYLPAVVLRASQRDQSLALVTTREIGYLPKREEDAEAKRPPTACEWKFTAQIAAQVEGEDDVFRIALDHTYLSEALEALDGDVELRFATNTDPALLAALSAPTRLAVVMPMAMRE